MFRIQLRGRALCSVVAETRDRGEGLVGCTRYYIGIRDTCMRFQRTKRGHAEEEQKRAGD
jgi:hypothetical protein